CNPYRPDPPSCSVRCKGPVIDLSGTRTVTPHHRQNTPPTIRELTMTRKWSAIAAAGLLAAVTAGLLIAQDERVGNPTAAASRPTDDQNIRAAARAFARAFERGDAAAIAAVFTETGEYRDDAGTALSGRAALAKS